VGVESNDNRFTAYSPGFLLQLLQYLLVAQVNPIECAYG
jgi:hypothetical protein